MKIWSFFAIAAVFAVVCGGCCSFETNANAKKKFTRVFAWGTLRSEADTAKYAAAGVTDIQVFTKESFEWAKKYGITPYCKCFTPVGPHSQVMSPEETAAHNYINGIDLPKKLSRQERSRILDARRKEKNHRFGGNRIDPLDTINVSSMPCFASDKDLVMTKKKIDGLLKKAIPGVKGIYLDYFGYANHRGCYCKECLARYKAYLAKNKLPDTHVNKDIFYRDQLIRYYNQVVAYIKSKRPEFKIVAHFYPDFEPDPWFANRTSVDYAGQTVSWYFPWKPEDISVAVKDILRSDKKYYPHTEAIPFIGASTNSKGALGYKTPETIERELQTILAAGSSTLMVCSGSAIIHPDYVGVFTKYCGR